MIRIGDDFPTCQDRTSARARKQRAATKSKHLTEVSLPPLKIAHQPSERHLALVPPTGPALKPQGPLRVAFGERNFDVTQVTGLSRWDLY